MLSTLEHHANIVPWQLVAQRTGAVIRSSPSMSRAISTSLPIWPCWDHGPDW